MGTDDRSWVSDEDIAALQLERSVHGPGESNTQQAQRLFEENAPGIAMRLIQLARNGQSETTRLKASIYCIDRALGRVGEAKMLDADKKDVFEQLYDVVTRGATEEEERAIKKAKGL